MITLDGRDTMKKAMLLGLTAILLVSCTPVIRKDLMTAGTREFSYQDLITTPDAYRGKPFILGGIIVTTKLTDAGSLIEALYVPVDSLGSLRGLQRSPWRFLALYPRDKAILDPMIYSKDRTITVAGTFEGLESGKIDEMAYTYPVFRIDEVYLWADGYAGFPAYPRIQPYPYWGGPFFGPPGYPYRYWR
jgi:outer membrane lipoprotein